MEQNIKHIKEDLDPSIQNDGYIMSTKFGNGTLLVYLANEFDEYFIEIEKYFDISKQRKVKLSDFKKGGSLWI